MIDRRALLLGSAWTLAVAPALAQLRTSVPHVGILNYATDDDIRVRQFRQALQGLGYVEGKNVAITLRSANGALDELPGLAAALVADKSDVIIALGPAAWAAKRTTTTVPVVIAFSGDPVGDGIVPSIARPGGNITGFSYMSSDLAGKRLELLSNVFPQSKRLGVLYNPREPATRLEMKITEEAAQSLGVALVPVAADSASMLDNAFQMAVDQQVGGLVVFTHGFAVLNRARIIELAARHRLPMLYGWRDFVDDGGLMSYGPDIEVLVRRAATYVDLIIKGARAGDLPFEQPTRLQLVVNLKTAATLGLTIPPSILIRADEVIE
jgi:putative tryptophan/tyrosine transport system substrate-binding protein